MATYTFLMYSVLCTPQAYSSLQCSLRLQLIYRMILGLQHMPTVAVKLTRVATD